VHAQRSSASRRSRSSAGSSALFHKADDRLFAAKLVRENRATVVALAHGRAAAASRRA
jgi:hypothetical protein